jgi:lysophospholipase L1-like esterase
MLLALGVTWCTFFTLCQARGAEVPFELKGGERIVFFGDSITQAGGYIADIEVFLLTRFPDRTFVMLNHGKSSETISGTSELDHHPRRPDAHLRFTRDVVAWRPDVVVACFGMNDGNYHPFEPERFSRYQAGIQRMIARTRDEAHARLVLLSPPPFDPYRRLVGDPEAAAFGYKFPAVDYDQALERYSRWLLTLAGQDSRPTVVDIHGALGEHLRRRREGQVSFYLSGDAVHPGPTGHWLMAQALLLAWRAPSKVAEVRISAATEGPRVLAGAVERLACQGDGRLSFSWHTPLPLPIDPAWDGRSLELEQFTRGLNQYRMTIEGLPAARYRLLARVDGEPAEIEVTRLTRQQLEQGLDLTSLERFPTVSLARAVRTRVLNRRQTIDARWRSRIEHEASYRPEPSSAEFRGDDPAMVEIRGMCRQRDIHVQLVPLE